MFPFVAVTFMVTDANGQPVVDQRAADCTAQADAKGLQGEERFAFRARCKASGGAPTGLPATPNPSTTSNQPTTVPSNPARNAVKGAKRPSPPEPSLRARPTVVGSNFLGDWGSPNCDPMSKHKTFSLNEAGQFLTVNTEEGDPGDPFPALQVKDKGSSIVVTNDVGGKLMFSTFVKDAVGMVLTDTRYSDGSIFIEGAHILQRRLGGWRDEDLHFVRCSQ